MVVLLHLGALALCLSHLKIGMNMWVLAYLWVLVTRERIARVLFCIFLVLVFDKVFIVLCDA